MKRSIVRRFVLPFVQWYALMFIIAIAIDYILHRFNAISAGRYLGYAGTLLIAVSFIYSLRKRKIILFGSPRNLLIMHEYMAWAGSIMILVHAGIHFNALLPWLAVLMLLIAVASGLIGKFLLKRSVEALREKVQAEMKSGMTKEEAEKKLFLDSLTVDLMKKWRTVHMPITLLLILLVILNVITIIMFVE